MPIYINSTKVGSNAYDVHSAVSTKLNKIKMGNTDVWTGFIQLKPLDYGAANARYARPIFYDGEFHILGLSSDHKTHEKFDTSNNRWVNVSGLPVAINSYTPCVFEWDGKICILNGNLLYSYNGSTWTSQQLPHSSSYAACVFNGKIYRWVIHTSSSTSLTSDLYAWDGTTDELIASNQQGGTTNGSNFVILGNKLYCVGMITMVNGTEYINKNYSIDKDNNVDSFNISNITMVNNMSAVAFDGNIYLIGGNNQYRRLVKGNPETGIWTTYNNKLPVDCINTFSIATPEPQIIISGAAYNYKQIIQSVDGDTFILQS